MESDKRPHYPCDFCEDELGLIENLLMGTQERPSYRGNSQNDRCGCKKCHHKDCDEMHHHKDCDDDRKICMCRCDDTDDDRHSDCDMPRFGDNVSLAIVYSPDQQFNDMYEPERGLEAGTLFKRLDKPFMGATVSGGCKR